MIQFDDFDGFDPKAGPHCIACETMLTDAVDGTLGEVDRSWFDRHIGSCVRCAEKLADAQRGSAWLEMLKTPRPEPGPEMLARILAQTSGADGSVAYNSDDSASDGFAAAPFPAYSDMAPFLAPVPIARPVPMPVMSQAIGQTFSETGGGTMGGPGEPAGNILPFQAAARRRTALETFGRILLEPRLAMTAAMAFFSIALTLNLTGVRLDQMRASDLKPESLRRDYYQASARAVQYYDNLRVVHVMESRVEDLKQATQDSEQERRIARPATEAKPQSGPPSGSESPSGTRNNGKPEGTSRREPPQDAHPQPRVLLAAGSVAIGKTGGRA
jgi:hypothetical protein